MERRTATKGDCVFRRYSDTEFDLIELRSMLRGGSERSSLYHRLDPVIDAVALAFQGDVFAMVKRRSNTAEVMVASGNEIRSPRSGLGAEMDAIV